MDPAEALLSIRNLVKGDPKVYHSYHPEFQNNPKPYMEIAEACEIEVVKYDLERDPLNMHSVANYIVFTENTRAPQSILCRVHPHRDK